MSSRRDRSDSPTRARHREESASSSSHRRRRDEDRERDRRRSKRSRSRSGERDRRYDGRRSDKEPSSRHRERRRREETPESDVLLDLKEMGVGKLDEEGDFLDSPAFTIWLEQARDKYLDKLPREEAQKYFRRFVRRWNDGALPETYYRLAALINNTTITSSANGHSSSSSTQVPGLTPADRQLALERAQDARKTSRKAALKAAYAKADELVPRSGGKEGRMDEKRATNAANREMREGKWEGAAPEVDEKTLMGDSGGFAAALRARDAAQARKLQKREVQLADRRAAESDRLQDRKRKESETMEMFRAMARERFG